MVAAGSCTQLRGIRYVTYAGAAAGRRRAAYRPCPRTGGRVSSQPDAPGPQSPGDGSIGLARRATGRPHADSGVGETAHVRQGRWPHVRSTGRGQPTQRRRHSRRFALPRPQHRAPINTIIGATASALRHVAPGAAPWRCVAASRPPASRRDRRCPRPGPSSVACRCPGVGLLRPCAPGLAVIDLEIASRTDGRSVHAPRDERFAPTA